MPAGCAGDLPGSNTMFERWLEFFPTRRGVRPDTGPVAQWGSERGLHHAVIGQHGFELSGRLLEREMRAQGQTSSWPYIQGWELRARVDLGLPPAGQVVVMSNALHRTLEAHADSLYRDAVGSVKTSVKTLPPELRWLSQLPAGRWAGPAPRFWSRYRVFCDASDLARLWLDEDAQALLLTGDDRLATQVPLLVMLERGKCYLRLQLNPHAAQADAVLALDLLEHLSAHALDLAARARAAG